MTSKKWTYILFLVYVISNYQNNCFEPQTHFCVNEPTLNNGKSIQTYHKKKKQPQNNLLICLLILLLKYLEYSSDVF